MTISGLHCLLLRDYIRVYPLHHFSSLTERTMWRVSSSVIVCTLQFFYSFHFSLVIYAFSFFNRPVLIIFAMIVYILSPPIIVVLACFPHAHLMKRHLKILIGLRSFPILRMGSGHVLYLLFSVFHGKSSCVTRDGFESSPVLGQRADIHFPYCSPAVLTSFGALGFKYSSSSSKLPLCDPDSGKSLISIKNIERTDRRCRYRSLLQWDRE